MVGLPIGQAPSDAVFSFSRALEHLKLGKKVAREGWNGRGMWIALQVPDEHSKMTLPYIYMFTVNAELVPWVASQTDLLAEDWVLVH
jgi:uncharacterized protein DUF2829